MLRRRVALFFVLFIAVVATACLNSKQPARTGLLAQQDNVRATETEVWIRLDNFAGSYIRAVELAADRIRASTTNPVLRRLTLEWKINVSNSVMQSTSHPDAVIAILDTWTLLYQFRDYVASSAFAAITGEYQGELLSNYDRILGEYDAMIGAMTVSGDAPTARAFAERFAREHPFERGGVRPSALTEMISEVPQESRGALASVTALTKTFETLSSRVAIYTDLIPKMARWHAELVLEDPRYATLIDDTHTTLNEVRGSLGEITTIVRDSPALDERFEASVGSVVAGLQDAVVQLERIVNAQRRQVEGLVDSQRELATGFVSAERAVILDAVSTQLDTVTARVDELAARTVDDAGVTAQEVVEQAYGRALRLLIVLLVGLLVLMLVHRFLYRRTTA